MEYIDGWGKPWKYARIPEYIKELNTNPIGIEHERNGWWFSREMKLKNDNFKVDVLYEIDDSGKCRLYTDDLKYKQKCEIIFDKDIQCFTIKGLDNLRTEWRKTYPEENVLDRVFEKLIEREV